MGTDHVETATLVDASIATDGEAVPDVVPAAPILVHRLHHLHRLDALGSGVARGRLVRVVYDDVRDRTGKSFDQLGRLGVPKATSDVGWRITCFAVHDDVRYSDGNDGTRRQTVSPTECNHLDVYFVAEPRTTLHYTRYFCWHVRPDCTVKCGHNLGSTRSHDRWVFNTLRSQAVWFRKQ
uniref:Uncharacterized protein n=1 Tax=Anopheles triannulatus TaxID=58253 RepID=A0A2M4A515_9DIPT